MVKIRSTGTDELMVVLVAVTVMVMMTVGMPVVVALVALLIGFSMVVSVVVTVTMPVTMPVSMTVVRLMLMGRGPVPVVSHPGPHVGFLEGGRFGTPPAAALEMKIGRGE